VYLHIGEPKTGTTFLQQVIWRNREALGRHGIVVPGESPHDHFRAVQDLRDVTKPPGNPAPSWDGAWDHLAQHALRPARASLISHELLAAATPDQAARAVHSFGDAEVHVVLTVRDMASLIPAEWQETIKHRNTRAWDDWLGDVIDTEAVSEDRRQWWFWRVHDTLAILDIWGRYVPADRVHVITVPGRAARPGVLWERMAALLGVDPAAADTSFARQNSSLGMAEVELLRRLNAALPEQIPDWFYMWNVKEPLAHGALAAGRTSDRLVLPAARLEWARAHAAGVIDALRGSSYDVIGDLDELVPAPAAGPGAHPDDASDADLVAAAVVSIAALLERQYRRRQAGASSVTPGASLIARGIAAVESSPVLSRRLRDLSGRYRWAGRARGMARRARVRTGNFG
jgi:hypothetical protein